MKRGIHVNIAYFLTPKNDVAYLYDDFTFRQGLEKMRRHGFTAVPVMTRVASSTIGTPVTLLIYGTVREARGLTSMT